MSVQVIDNFSYKGKKGNFERDNFDTLQAMRSYPEDGIDDGHVCFCNEDGNHYKFNRLNSVDGTTGRWRLHNKSVNTLTETGEGKVLDARQGKILKDLIDAKVIEAGGVSFDTVPTKGSTNPVTSNGIREAMDEQAESINSNIGVDDYPVFSTTEDYKSGDVVNYNGKLYKFTSDHAAGAWTGTDVEETDVVKAHIVQELGDNEDKVVSQKVVKDVSKDVEYLNDNSAIIKNGEADFAISDKDNNDIVQFNKGHIRTKNFDSNKLYKKTIKDLLLGEMCDINHVIGYGQSLMAGSFSGTPVSINCAYNNLIKFSGGVRPYDIFGLDSNRHTYLKRLKSIQYGEMFKTPEENLSKYDNDCINEAFVKFVPLTETMGKYSENANVSSDGHSYNYDISGNITHRHANGETVLTGFCEMLDDLYAEEYGTDKFGFELLASCAAYGSANFQSLLPIDRGGGMHIDLDSNPEGDGSNMNYFENLMLQVTKAKELADKQGKSYCVKYVIYFEESCNIDTSPNIVAYRILQLFTLINTRIKSITKQTNDVIFFEHCSNTPTDNYNIAQYILASQSELSLTEDEISTIQSSSLYDVEPYDLSKVYGSHSIQGYEPAFDNIHRTASAQKQIGVTIAILAKQHTNVLYAKKAKVMGNDIYVTYNVPIMPIAIADEAPEGVEKISNGLTTGNVKGFLIKDIEGEVKNIITSVSIVEGNMIKISCSSSPSGYILEYAHTRYDNGSTKWRCGNVRDSQGDVLSININGVDYPLYNWCYSFKFNL